MTDSLYTRTEILLGAEPLKNLCQHHVLIAGLGGVGSFAAEAIGRAGIAHLSLLDHDVVAVSNLNRQLVALNSTVGQRKTDVMAARLRDINPTVVLTEYSDFLQKSEADNFIATHRFDYVIDCIDSIACKAAMVAACLRHQVPVISSMGAGNRFDVTQVRITTLDKVEGCALAREMRSHLRKLNAPLHYPVVSSREKAQQPLPHQPVVGGRPRAVNGTISYMPALFGMMAAGYVIKQLLEKS